MCTRPGANGRRADSPALDEDEEEDDAVVARAAALGTNTAGTAISHSVTVPCACALISVCGGDGVMEWGMAYLCAPSVSASRSCCGARGASRHTAARHEW